MKLVITIEVPGGADVVFEDATPLPPGPEIPNEEIESLAALPVQQIIPPYQPVTTSRVNPLCPKHGVSHFIPAGTSKTSGKKYRAFWGCTEMDCDWRQNA